MILLQDLSLTPEQLRDNPSYLDAAEGFSITVVKDNINEFNRLNCV